MVADRPKPRISPTDIDQLMIGLEVHMSGLAQCVIDRGWRLSFNGGGKTSIHYTLYGNGIMTVGDFPPIKLVPHSMVIVPSMLPMRIEVDESTRATTRSFDVAQLEEGRITEFVAGSGSAELVVMCGYFQTSYGKSIDIFNTVSSPIVEQFDASDRIDQSLVAVYAESGSQRIGRAAMMASLLKQVILTLLRRSFESPQLWAERFPILDDPQIARAFACMVSEPGQDHTTNSLSLVAGLSRSAFMSRFTRALGVSPLAALRQLRMRRAASLLDANIMPVEQVAKTVGYVNRSSFSRAFRAVYGVDPTEYRSSNSLSTHIGSN